MSGTVMIVCVTTVVVVTPSESPTTVVVGVVPGVVVGDAVVDVAVSLSGAVVVVSVGVVLGAVVVVVVVVVVVLVVVVVDVVVVAAVAVRTPATYVMSYPTAVPPEHVTGYVPAGDDEVYVVVQVSPVRVTSAMDGVPVIVGVGSPTVTFGDGAVTLRRDRGSIERVAVAT